MFCMAEEMPDEMRGIAQLWILDKDGKPKDRRLCIDVKRLNELLAAESYLLDKYGVKSSSLAEPTVWDTMKTTTGGPFAKVGE